MASATTVGSQVFRPSFVVQQVEKQKGKGQGKKGNSKGWNDSKGATVEKGWSNSNCWFSSGKGWEQQRPAGMNNLERDAKEYGNVDSGENRESTNPDTAGHCDGNSAVAGA